jgi:hypothetical protein
MKQLKTGDMHRMLARFLDQEGRVHRGNHSHGEPLGGGRLDPAARGGVPTDDDIRSSRPSPWWQFEQI